MTARKRTTTKKPSTPTSTSNTGAHIAYCTISQQGVVHNEHTATAVTALANGVIANANALKAAAEALAGHGVQMGHGISLANVRADDAA